MVMHVDVSSQLYCSVTTTAPHEIARERTYRQRRERKPSSKRLECSRGTGRHGKATRLVGSATPSTATMYARSRKGSWVSSGCRKRAGLESGVLVFGTWVSGVRVQDLEDWLILTARGPPGPNVVPLWTLDHGGVVKMNFK